MVIKLEKSNQSLNQTRNVINHRLRKNKRSHLWSGLAQMPNCKIRLPQASTITD